MTLNGIWCSCLSSTSFEIRGILLEVLPLSHIWQHPWALYSFVPGFPLLFPAPSDLGLPVILIGPFLIFSESHMRAVSSDTQFKLFMFPFQYVPDQQQGPQVESSNWKAANAWMPRFPSPLDILDSYILSGLMLVFWLQCVWISASAQATVKGSLLVSSSTFASLDLSVPLRIPLRSLLRDSF